MKAVVILLFSLTSTFAQIRRSNSHGDIVETPVKQPQASDPSAQRVVMRRPEYEVKTYDTVISSELVCCVTKTQENNQAHISQSDPSHLSKYPTEHNQLEENRRDVVVRNLANIFSQALLETILKLIHSVLNTFEGPHVLLRPSNEAPKENNYALSSSTNQVKHFLQGLNSQPVLSLFPSEEALFQPNHQDIQQKNYNCKLMPMNKC